MLGYGEVETLLLSVKAEPLLSLTGVVEPLLSLTELVEPLLTVTLALFPSNFGNLSAS